MSIYDVRESVQNIRSNVKKIMEDQGVSCRKLAERTKLSKLIVERARKDDIKKCKLETLVIIANALGVSVKDLFDEV